MARFHFLSGEGETLFLAHRLAREGHDVTFYVLDDGARKTRLGEGLVRLPPTPDPPRGAVCIFDMPGKGQRGKEFRRRGFPVIGGNPFDRELELDRAQGTALMQAAGIATPQTYVMASIAQAQAFLATKRGVWFFKPNGKTTTLTHHGEPGDLIRWLDWAAQFVKGEPFELQQALSGIEVSTEGWFDGKRFVPPFNSTLEEKHFLAGDLGPRTGCESNVVWTWQGDPPPLAKKTVCRIEPMLRAEGYVGPIDLNTILPDSGVPHGLEWSARLGFDASQAYSMLIDGDYGAQLEKFATGNLREWRVRPHEFAMTLRVTTPPYPVENTLAANKVAGLPLDPAIVSHPDSIFPCDVRVEHGKPVLAGWHGYVCCVGATGKTFAACRRQVLKTAEELHIPEKQYRVDPVHRAEDAWEHLRQLGHLHRALPQAA